MGDMSSVNALGSLQAAQAICNKPQGHCNGQENQDIFALLFQNLQLLGQAHQPLDNNGRDLIQGEAKVTESEIADLLDFNQNIDWPTFSLINSLTVNNQSQLHELQSLISQMANGNNQNAKIIEVLNILNSSQQPQDDLLSMFSNLPKEEQQLLYTQLKLIVELDHPKFTANTDVNNLAGLTGNLQNFEKYSKDLKAFLNLVEKDFNLEPGIIEAIAKDINKLKLNGDSQESFDNVNIQSILKALTLNQQKANFESGQLTVDSTLSTEPDITSLDSSKLIIQNINLSNNTLDNTQLVNKQQVLEKLYTGQTFTSDLGKVIIKNLQLPNGTTETKIQLFPQELGQIDVKLSTNNGQITAQFIAETAMGRELLEGQISQLKQALVQQGYQVDKIEVQQQSQVNNNLTQGLKSGFNFSGQQSAKQHSNQQAHYYSNSYSEEGEEFNKELFSLSGIDYTV